MGCKTPTAVSSVSFLLLYFSVSGESHLISIEPELNGYCLSSGGHDQNDGTQSLNSGDKDACYHQCKAVPQATGCQWHKDGGCAYHTLDVSSGNGNSNYRCWVFNSSPTADVVSSGNSQLAIGLEDEVIESVLPSFTWIDSSSIRVILPNGVEDIIQLWPAEKVGDMLVPCLFEGKLKKDDMSVVAVSGCQHDDSVRIDIYANFLQGYAATFNIKNGITEEIGRGNIGKINNVIENQERKTRRKRDVNPDIPPFLLYDVKFGYEESLLAKLGSHEDAQEYIMRVFTLAKVTMQHPSLGTKIRLRAQLPIQFVPNKYWSGADQTSLQKAMTEAQTVKLEEAVPVMFFVGSGTLSVSYPRRGCDPRRGLGIQPHQDDLEVAVVTYLHDVGHWMGLRHDEDEDSRHGTQCAGTGLMSEQVEPKKRPKIWSSCSQSKFSKWFHHSGSCLKIDSGCKADEIITSECTCGSSSCAVGSVCAAGTTCTPVCQADVLSETDCLCGDSNCGAGSTCVGGTTCTAEDCQSGETHGSDYDGNVNTTPSGRICQNWSSQSPHEHQFGSIGNHNFCRNPDGGSGVWCFTTDPDERFEYCNVPICGCKADEIITSECTCGSSSCAVGSVCAAGTTCTPDWGEWGSWSEMETCTRRCGGGKQRFKTSRSCNPPTMCKEVSRKIEERDCNTRACKCTNKGTVADFCSNLPPKIGSEERRRFCNFDIEEKREALLCDQVSPAIAEELLNTYLESQRRDCNYDPIDVLDGDCGQLLQDKLSELCIDETCKANQTKVQNQIDEVIEKTDRLYEEKTEEAEIMVYMKKGQKALLQVANNYKEYRDKQKELMENVENKLKDNDKLSQDAKNELKSKARHTFQKNVVKAKTILMVTSELTSMKQKAGKLKKARTAIKNQLSKAKKHLKVISKTQTFQKSTAAFGHVLSSVKKFQKGDTMSVVGGILDIASGISQFLPPPASIITGTLSSILNIFIGGPSTEDVIKNEFKKQKEWMEGKFDAIDKRFDALSSDIKQQFGNIESKLDKRFDALSSDITQKFGNIESKLDNLKESIADQTEEIKSFLLQKLVSDQARKAMGLWHELEKKLKFIIDNEDITHSEHTLGIIVTTMVDFGKDAKKFEFRDFVKNECIGKSDQDMREFCQVLAFATLMMDRTSEIVITKIMAMVGKSSLNTLDFTGVLQTRKDEAYTFLNLIFTSTKKEEFSYISCGLSDRSNAKLTNEQKTNLFDYATHLDPSLGLKRKMEQRQSCVDSQFTEPWLPVDGDDRSLQNEIRDCCEKGKKTQKKTCSPPENGGVDACAHPALSTDSVRCEGYFNLDCPGINAMWTAWGACSQTCGGGRKRRECTFCSWPEEEDCNTFPCECEIEDNVNYDKHDVTGGLSSDGPKSCAEQCLAEPTCLFWTMRHSTYECFLKSSKAGRERAYGLFSGSKACGGAVLSRQQNIADLGYHDCGAGWYDVQGQGVKNDYCRWVGNCGCRGHCSFWSCALAGSNVAKSSKGQFTEPGT